MKRRLPTAFIPPKREEVPVVEQAEGGEASDDENQPRDLSSYRHENPVELQGQNFRQYIDGIVGDIRKLEGFRKRKFGKKNLQEAQDSVIGLSDHVREKIALINNQTAFEVKPDWVYKFPIDEDIEKMERTWEDVKGELGASAGATVLGAFGGAIVSGIAFISWSGDWKFLIPGIAGGIYGAFKAKPHCRDSWSDSRGRIGKAQKRLNFIYDNVLEGDLERRVANRVGEVLESSLAVDSSVASFVGAARNNNRKRHERIYFASLAQELAAQSPNANNDVNKLGALAVLTSQHKGIDLSEEAQAYFDEGKELGMELYENLQRIGDLQK